MPFLLMLVMTSSANAACSKTDLDCWKDTTLQLHIDVEGLKQKLEISEQKRTNAEAQAALWESAAKVAHEANKEGLAALKPRPFHESAQFGLIIGVSVGTVVTAAVVIGIAYALKPAFAP